MEVSQEVPIGRTISFRLGRTSDGDRVLHAKYHSDKHRDRLDVFGEVMNDLSELFADCGYFKSQSDSDYSEILEDIRLVDTEKESLTSVVLASVHTKIQQGLIVAFLNDSERDDIHNKFKKFAAKYDFINTSSKVAVFRYRNKSGQKIVFKLGHNKAGRRIAHISFKRIISYEI